MQENLTRRQFLRTTAAGGIGGATALAGHANPNIDTLRTGVATISGVPTFVCNGKPVPRPTFETYAPTQYYFEEFTGAGTKIFGFSTNAAACD